jgi:hypothetical protein
MEGLSCTNFYFAPDKYARCLEHTQNDPWGGVVLPIAELLKLTTLADVAR